MTNLSISNISELQAEIARLKSLGMEQKEALVLRFKGPKAIFLSVKSLFPKAEGGGAGLFHPDLLNVAARFLLPLTLNKTIFKHSNFLVRSLVGLVSQKAAGYVTGDSAENLLGKAKSLFSKWFDKTKLHPQTHE